MQMFCVCKCIVCLPSEYVHSDEYLAVITFGVDVDWGDKVYQDNPLISILFY